MAFSPDGATLASGGLRGESVVLWDVASGQTLGEPLVGPDLVTDVALNGVTELAFSPDGGTLAVGRIDGGIVLWDVPSRQPLGALLVGDIPVVSSMAFSPDRGDAGLRQRRGCGLPLGRRRENVAAARLRTRRPQPHARGVVALSWNEPWSENEEPFRATCDAFPEDIVLDATSAVTPA